jgi:hypothetical protein
MVYANEKPEYGPDSGTDSSRQVADLIQNFGLVVAPGSEFGISRTRARMLRASGKLTATDIDAALRLFVQPAMYAEARTALRRDHVVVLEGRRGVGKRTSAIALLAGEAERLLVLPPSTLDDLAERKYDKDFGYVMDGQGEQEPGATTDPDFAWRAIRDRVRDAGAYLTVTSRITSPGKTPEAVRHIAWAAPPIDEVLRGYLSGDESLIQRIIRHLSGTIGEDCPMAHIAELARRIGNGEDIDIVLAELDVTARYVKDWFDKGRTRGEILEITGLAFMAGVNERTFESALKRLNYLVAEAIPPPEAAEDAAVKDELPQKRSARLGDGLIIRNVANGPVSRRVLTFRRPIYQRHVLAELSSRYPAEFWDAVRTWLDQIVENGDGALVAAGLALLATVDFGEVKDSYLEPWSKGDRGWPGQMTAAYVLWLMCYDEAALPLALATAIRWAGNGGPAQRWAAAVSFSGQLGVLYPAEAVRRLWQLIIQSADIGGDACNALAGLFASLVDVGENAGTVLTMLDRQRAELLLRGRANQHVLTRTMSATLAVLSIREVKGPHLAILKLIRAQPERVCVIGRLWAATLCHRGYRRAALDVLRAALRALPETSPAPEDDARALGEALAAALPSTEVSPLKRDLTILETRFRRGTRDSLAQILLTALDRAMSQQALKGK